MALGPDGTRTTALRARALVFGAAIGVVGAVSNVLVSLKTGWSLPVMTTAAFLGIAASRFDRRELTALTSTASAAAYMTGGGNLAALPVVVMLGLGSPHPALVAVFWVATALLGTLVAPLLRQKTVDDERLAFPTAAATTTIVTAANEAGSPARAHAHAHLLRPLGASTAVGLAAAFGRRALGAPETVALPGSIGGHSLGSLTFGLDTSLVLAGAGALMRLRTALSTLAGSVVTYLALGPWLVARGIVKTPSYAAFVELMVWPSAALFVSAISLEALLDLPRQIREGTVGLKRVKQTEHGWARLWVLVALGLGVAALACLGFGASIGFAVATLPLVPLVAFVAARAMGETDVVPTKALASLIQLLFGGLGAGAATINVVPNVACGAAIHAADTVGSLRVAKATGVGTREVLAARAVGIVVGAAGALGGYLVFVPDASRLPTADLPAPAILVWRSVTLAMSDGLASFPYETRVALALGAALGMALTTLERILPPRLARFVPSAVGLGSGMVLPASNAITIALGALARAAHDSRASVDGSAAKTERSQTVAAGVIVGESLAAMIAQIARIFQVV